MSEFVKAMLDISIFHLTEDTRRRMDADSRNFFLGKPCSLPFTIRGSSFGWFIDIRSAAERHCATAPYPSDIVECYDLGLRLNCDYILFDRDAERHAELAWYGDRDQEAWVEKPISVQTVFPPRSPKRGMLLNDLAYYNADLDI